MLAAPKSSAEKARFDTICRIAEERGVSYTVYNEDTFLSFGHCDITLLSSERRFDREKADYAIRVAAFDRSLLFCSCAAAEVYPPERLLPLLRESSVLLFSPQGPSAARWNQLYNRLSLECMVVGKPDNLCLPEENKTGETVLVSPEEYLVTFRR